MNSTETKSLTKFACKKIAEKHELVFVPLQTGFNALCEKAQENYRLVDGVHTTEMGHEFIKNEWIKAFKAL